MLVLLAWWTGREADEIPRWLTGLLIASVPGVYAISFLVTMAAGVGIIYLPGALLTAPLPILLVMRRSRAPVTAAIGALIVSIAVLSLPLIPGSSGIDPLPIVAAIPQLALFGCWVLFIPAMRNIGEIYDRERRRALAAAVQSASQAAVTEARARWVAAGAGSAAELLHNIATGAVDPYDERVQARCAAEEQYLRQLLSFDANLVHLSPWLALALANARARGVNLEIRGGSIDAANGPSARLVGRVLLAVIQSTEEGEGLRLSLLTQAGQPTCMLLGPGRIADQISLALADHDSHLRISAVGERALIETTPVPT